MGVVFKEDTHQYFVDGVELPSVTDITRFCHYDRMAKARSGNDPFYRNRGTEVHRLCLELDMDGPDGLKIGTGYDGYVRAYAAFLLDYRISDWMYMECPMASKSLGYAGTPDRVGYTDGILTIIDFKTGVIDKVALSAQLTGYAELVQRLIQVPSWPPPLRLWGLRLQKTGKYTIADVPLDYKLFSACRTLHDRYGKG